MKTATGLFVIILLCPLICSAMTISITGTVIDDEGVGIAGADVALENACVATTTGPGGNFSLIGESIISNRNSYVKTGTPNNAIAVNGQLRVHLSSPATVTLIAYTLQGRMVSTAQTACGAGEHVLSLPVTGKGIHVYRACIGAEEILFRSSVVESNGVAISANRLKGSSVPLARQADATTVIDDVIAVSKDGYLRYRAYMTTPETTGVEIILLYCAGVIADSSGNEYQTVRLGEQVWTVSDLRTTKYNDGTPVPHVTDSAAWSVLSTPAYCFYNNSVDPSTHEKWGALYNWYAVNTGKLAPEGWRVPSVEDWTKLEIYLMSNGYNCDGSVPVDPYNTIREIENRIAKSLASQTGWKPYFTTSFGSICMDPVKNNRSGFSGQPAGWCDPERGFVGQGGIQCIWWSSTRCDEDSSSFDSNNAWNFSLFCYRFYPRYLCTEMAYGLSVRLVRE